MAKSWIPRHFVANMTDFAENAEKFNVTTFLFGGTLLGK
jgi:hypothetical protein